MSEWLMHAAFAAGGGLGAVARHALTRLVTHRLPLSTLLVNVAGTLVLGAVAGVAARDGWSLPEEGRRSIVGFCGGFTTFSSFAYQSLELHRERTLLHAAGNIVASLALCLIAFGAGRAIVLG